FQKILVGGDDRSDLEDLEKDLFGGKAASPVNKQFSVSCASSGKEALDMVRRACQQGKPFTMAFVDMRMPGWDGVETITQLVRVQPTLQFAICSAYMDYSWHDVLSRLNRPGLRLLRKPWTSGEVLALVHELCGRAAQASRANASKPPP